jgi:uncharacterized protein YkwD
MKTIVAAAALALIAGCHRHHFVDDPPSPWYATYGNGHPLAASPGSGFIVSQESDLASRINNHRASIGLPALIDQGQLRDLSRAHSIHMAIHGFESDINPEGDSPADRLDAMGIGYAAVGENVVYDWSDPADAYWEMINDPGMHANIDDPSFWYFGAGYEHDSGSIWNDYWTVIFREP